MKRECNECKWVGGEDDCVWLGAIGPLCPECHETTMKDDMEMLTAPPKVGDKVAVVMHSGQWNAPRKVRKSTVVAVCDHKPVDGTDERNALVDLADGTAEFWWNLTHNV